MLDPPQRMCRSIYSHYHEKADVKTSPKTELQGRKPSNELEDVTKASANTATFFRIQREKEKERIILPLQSISFDRSITNNRIFA